MLNEDGGARMRPRTRLRPPHRDNVRLGWIEEQRREIRVVDLSRDDMRDCSCCCCLSKRAKHWFVLIVAPRPGARAIVISPVVQNNKVLTCQLVGRSDISPTDAAIGVDGCPRCVLAQTCARKCLRPRAAQVNGAFQLERRRGVLPHQARRGDVLVANRTADTRPRAG
jgi:hypothetical protein